MLQEIGKKHGTDKWSQTCFQGESYLHIYHRYFDPIRHQPLNILELGAGAGASLRMWKEYFPQAQIFGVDINPDSKGHEEERISISILSQDDKVGLEDLASSAGGFDIIIDDASHITQLTLASYQILFPHLNVDGYYVIEDLIMSYWDYSSLKDKDTFWGGLLLRLEKQGVNLKQSRASMTEFFAAKLADLDNRRGEIRFIHFWSMLAIIQKGSSGI